MDELITTAWNDSYPPKSVMHTYVFIVKDLAEGAYSEQEILKSILEQNRHELGYESTISEAKEPPRTEGLSLLRLNSSAGNANHTYSRLSLDSRGLSDLSNAAVQRDLEVLQREGENINFSQLSMPQRNLLVRNNLL